MSSSAAAAASIPSRTGSVAPPAVPSRTGSAAPPVVPSLTGAAAAPNHYFHPSILTVDTRARKALHLDVVYAGTLALSSGFVSGCSLRRFDTFPGAMTGNTVRLGMAISSGDTKDIFLYATILVSFFSGSFGGFAAESRGPSRGSFRWVCAPLILACLVLLEVLKVMHVVDGVNHTGLASGSAASSTAAPQNIRGAHRWGSVLAAFAMGMTDVVAYTGRLRGAWHVSFMTGKQ